MGWQMFGRAGRLVRSDRVVERQQLDDKLRIRSPGEPGGPLRNPGRALHVLSGSNQGPSSGRKLADDVLLALSHEGLHVYGSDGDDWRLVKDIEHPDGGPWAKDRVPRRWWGSFHDRCD